MPIHPSPQLIFIKQKIDISFSSKTYSQCLLFLLQTCNRSKDKVFMPEVATGRNIETCQTCSAYFSRSAMKIKIMLPGNYLQCDIVCIYNQISIILSDWRTTYLCKQSVRSSWIHSSGFDNWFLIPIAITFRVTLCIRCIIPHYCQWRSNLSVLLLLLWVMMILIFCLNWRNLIVQKSENV
jgi:hypothetical protein